MTHCVAQVTLLVEGVLQKLKSLTKLLAQVPGVVIIDSWENSIELRGGDKGWVNVVVQKKEAA